jgi:hypothetical protein
MKTTKLIDRLHKLAVENGLSCPMGRALAMTNRHYNDGWGSTSYDVSGGPKSDLDAMRRMSDARAQRWLKHWSEGGSLRKLGISCDEQLRRRRERYNEMKDVINRYRRVDAARRREEKKDLRDGVQLTQKAIDILRSKV